MYQRKLTVELDRWKASTSRKPLIIRGARQVGKTTLVGMFATGFDYYIPLNLDKSGNNKNIKRQRIQTPEFAILSNRKNARLH